MSLHLVSVIVLGAAAAAWTCVLVILVRRRRAKLPMVLSETDRCVTRAYFREDDVVQALGRYLIRRDGLAGRFYTIAITTVTDGRLEAIRVEVYAKHDPADAWKGAK